jgi:hypothetical protein
LGLFCSVVLVCQLHSLLAQSIFEDDGGKVLIVGMLNAIQGIGAGGSRASETSLVAKGNAALYSCFAVFGIFSGSVINTIGPKIPLMLYVPLPNCRSQDIRRRGLMSSGGIGYALYIGSLWCLAEGGPDGFVIASGAILGTTAALLCKSLHIYHRPSKSMS